MNRKSICFFMMMALIIACASSALADRVGTADSVTTGQVTGGSGNVYVKVQATVQASPVYCFYSFFMRDHMWTASAEEKQQLEENFRTGKETYQYQGIWGYAELAKTDWNMPVYRFWNKKTTDHFYTTSDSEKEQLEKDLKSGKDNYVYEGIAWYVPQFSDYPVYRFFDTASFNHYYTDDAQLKESLSKEYLAGTGTYRYEGVAWYWYK